MSIQTKTIKGSQEICL